MIRDALLNLSGWLSCMCDIVRARRLEREARRCWRAGWRTGDGYTMKMLHDSTRRLYDEADRARRGIGTIVTF